MARDDPHVERATEPLGGGDIGQFPQAAEQATRDAPTDDDLARVFDPDQRAREEWQLGGGLARRDHRQLALAAFRCRHASASERTREAARLFGGAQRRAELHETLVEIAGRGGLGQGEHQLAGTLPEELAAGGGLDVELDPEHAGEHARDVAIHQRHALVVGDRCDRARGVGPDAADRTQLGGGAWQLLADLACGRVQVAGARVVAEAGPLREHVVERRGGERAERRKLREPALPVRDDGRDARLLEHHLADPDRVRVARAAPRQVSLHRGVVRDHGFGDAAIHAAGPYKYRCAMNRTDGSKISANRVVVSTVTSSGMPFSERVLSIVNSELPAVMLTFRCFHSQMLTARP